MKQQEKKNEKLQELNEQEQQQTNGGFRPVNPYLDPIDGYGPSDTEPTTVADPTMTDGTMPQDPSRHTGPTGPMQSM